MLYCCRWLLLLLPRRPTPPLRRLTRPNTRRSPGSWSHLSTNYVMQELRPASLCPAWWSVVTSLQGNQACWRGCVGSSCLVLQAPAPSAQQRYARKGRSHVVLFKRSGVLQHTILVHAEVCMQQRLQNGHVAGVSALLAQVLGRKLKHSLWCQGTGCVSVK